MSIFDHGPRSWKRERESWVSEKNMIESARSQWPQRAQHGSTWKCFVATPAFYMFESAAFCCVLFCLSYFIVFFFLLISNSLFVFIHQFNSFIIKVKSFQCYWIDLIVFYLGKVQSSRSRDLIVSDLVRTCPDLPPPPLPYQLHPST